MSKYIYQLNVRFTHGQMDTPVSALSVFLAARPVELSSSPSHFHVSSGFYPSGRQAYLQIFRKIELKQKLYKTSFYSNHNLSPYTINSSSVYTYHGLVICSSDKTYYYPDLVELSPPSQCVASPVLLHVLHPSCFQSYSFLLSVV